MRNNQISDCKVKEIELQHKNIHRWVGAQIYKDYLYAIPNHENSILKINLKNKSDISYIGEFSNHKYKWTGGCIYKNKLWGFPRSANCFFSMDLVSEKIIMHPLCREYDGEHHYGGVCTRDGWIYQPPRNDDHFLVIDLNTSKSYELKCDFLTKTSRYCGSIVYDDNTIIFLPEHGRVIKYDLETKKFSFIGQKVDAMCFDAVKAQDGCIYGFSAYGNGILKVDVISNSSQMIHDDMYFGCYGTKLGFNGKAYGIPGDGTKVWELDLFSGVPRSIYNLKSKQKAKYAGGGVALNGKIYGVPADSNCILEIEYPFSDKNISCNEWRNIYQDFY